MPTKTIPEERIRKLNDRQPRDGQFVLYWMQQSQRVEENHALEYAVQRANERRQTLVVCFGLTDAYPEANLRHYAFMIEGLRDVAGGLRRRGILFVVRHGEPPEVALRIGRRASVIVCDRGYLRHQKRWRAHVAREATCAVEEVECDVVVPVDLVSDKQEYAARTIRPKLMRHAERFTERLIPTPLTRRSDTMYLEHVDIDDDSAVWKVVSVDTAVGPVADFRGGTTAARRRLRWFVTNRLADYAAYRSQPQTDFVSHMGMYLHYGQISPAYVARTVRDSRSGAAVDRESYIEELIVRRELTYNYVDFTENYDQYEAVPQWARTSLARHASDPRPFLYSRTQLEAAETHDPYWNAAMLEMKHTGYMHNHMRMYWGKKILEWSRTPKLAFQTALALNNRYFLDGRDPNSYANVAWIFGLHDRPWQERAIFGKVRSMTASGLERKADPAAYVAKVETQLKRQARRAHSGKDPSGH